jgi:hypothetical protein
MSVVADPSDRRLADRARDGRRRHVNDPSVAQAVEAERSRRAARAPVKRLGLGRGGRGRRRTRREPTVEPSATVRNWVLLKQRG